MFDNGLLKYYKDYADEQGMLKTFEAIGPGEYSYSSPNIKLYYVRDGEVSRKYFEKLFSYNTKTSVSAEVFQSQVFKANGLNTAIYTPSISKGKTPCVISNDISKPNSVSMVEFLDSVKKQGIIENSPYKKEKENTPEKISYEKIFTDKAMKDFILSHVLDVAGGNTDRHTRNFEVEVGKTESGLDIIEDITFFDYGETIFNSFKNREKTCLYKNGLGYGMDKNRGSMIAMFRNCPHILKYYQPEELAEIVGSVDVREIASDVKEETNFSLNRDYLESAERSYYNLAQDLVKGVKEDAVIQNLIK